MSRTLTATHVGVTRLAGHIGAEISGVDTGAPLSDEVVAKTCGCWQNSRRPTPRAG